MRLLMQFSSNGKTKLEKVINFKFEKKKKPTKFQFLNPSFKKTVIVYFKITLEIRETAAPKGTSY